MASGFTHDILVSYVAADRQWGERIASVLRQKYTVATLENGASTNPASLGDALSWAERIMPVFSKSSQGSADARFWGALYATGSMDGQQRVLPVSVDKCRFSGIFGVVKSLDLTTVAPDKLDARLLQAMGSVMGR